MCFIANMFNYEHDKSAPSDLDGESSESGLQYTRLMTLDYPTVERSIIIARQFVDGIQATVSPTVHRGLGMFERLPIPKFVADFRTRFNLRFARNPRLDRD